MFDPGSEPIDFGAGSLRVSSRPRGGDWLARDLEELVNQGVTDLVSLLTAAENRELDLTGEEQICRELGLRFHGYPIPDRCVPENRDNFLALARALADRVEAGAHALLHCRAGLGRAPLMAVAILTRSEMTVESAWSLLEKHRGRAVPDTEEQRAWLGNCDSLEEALRRAEEPFF